MANDYLGPIDQNVGYGGTGSAALYGLQQELARRDVLSRQAQLDADKRKKDALDAEVARENIASLQESRQAQAEQRRVEAKTAKQKQAVLGLGIGSISAAKAAELKGVGLDNLVSEQPATPEMTAGVPSQFAAVPDAASATEVPLTAAAPATTTFKGTPDQQTQAQHEKVAREILNGDHETGNETLDQFAKAQALQFLASGKEGAVPAGVITPKTQSEKDATRFYKIRAIQRQQKPVSPEDAAFADVYEKSNPTEATKQSNREINLNISQTGANKRQTSTQTFQTKQQFRRELTDNEKVVDKDIERTDRALTLLSSPNFVTDAVAGPEFLQIVAGGMGSGLRMTESELRRVNEAQTKIDQFKGQLAKWDILGIGDRRTIQDAMRAQMKDALEAVHAARERKAKLAEETLRGLEDAETQDEIDSLHSKYWSDRRVQGAMGAGNATSAAQGLPAGVTVTKRAK